MREPGFLIGHRPGRGRISRRGLLAGAAGSLALSPMASAHEQAHNPGKPLQRCASAGPLAERHLADPAGFAALQGTPVWKTIISHLLVNRDRQNPCFGFSDSESWTQVLARIPTDVLAVQVSEDGQDAILYVSGIADYLTEMPKLFSSFKPGETYGIFRISTKPVADERSLHDFTAKGTIGIFVNGVSIFSYTDTFSHGGTGLWSYDANVAEAVIVNSDVAHATPSNLPQFPKSRGIFHNHQMSVDLLQALEDPYFLGKPGHSKLVGFGMDSNPIYGPLGYASKDRSSGIKVLKSSYAKRAWLGAGQTGTGHRSSLPGWVVLNWDGGNRAGQNLVNLFQKPKAEVLFADGAATGPVTYAGTDQALAAELKALQQSVGLQRDSQGFVFWESSLALPGGKTAKSRNYLLKSSTLWGPGFDARILPGSYEEGDIDKFYFTAKLGSFAEDYDYVPGYGDLDFYNGIDSYLPERGGSAYHYVAAFSGGLQDAARLKSAAFPYLIGIQYKSKPDAFNDSLDTTGRKAYFTRHAGGLKTVLDLGIIGKDDKGKVLTDSVPAVWQQKLNEDL